MAKLYHFPLDPFSRRIRLALGEYKADVELVEERSWERRDAFLALNPAGAPPVLIEEDGSAIAGVEALSEYLEETRGVKNGLTLFGETPLQRAETRRLAAWFDVKFHREVSAPLIREKIERRLAGRDRGTGMVNVNAIRVALRNIREHLAYIGALSQARNWLAGDTLSHADLAAAAHISCVDYLGDTPWSENAAAKQWYQRIKSRPCFRPLLADRIRTMPPPRFYADLDF
ncbi:MAG: glutathione S-transferase family protein [Hyphomicrobiales bacterium]